MTDTAKNAGTAAFTSSNIKWSQLYSTIYTMVYTVVYSNRAGVGHDSACPIGSACGMDLSFCGRLCGRVGIACAFCLALSLRFAFGFAFRVGISRIERFSSTDTSRSALAVRHRKIHLHISKRRKLRADFLVLPPTQHQLVVIHTVR